jgi:hypothetical protein
MAAVLWVLVGVGGRQMGKRGALGWRDAGGRGGDGDGVGCVCASAGVDGCWGLGRVELAYYVICSLARNGDGLLGVL